MIQKNIKKKKKKIFILFQQLQSQVISVYMIKFLSFISFRNRIK